MAERHELRAFSDPLPPPDALQGYEEAFTGCAERIVAMAERQAAHRQQLESTKLRGDLSNERLGTLLGFILAAGTVIGGVWLLGGGRDVTGLIAMLTPLAGLSGLFVWGKIRNERQIKRQAESVDRAADHSPSAQR